MRADPPRRPDGRCARRGCNRSLRTPARPQKGVDPTVYEAEMFCSAACCRLFYGVDQAQPARACKGCGCDMDAWTAGCYLCEQRHAQRDRDARKAAA